MWKRNSYYTIPVQERMEFQAKLERIYLAHGKHIEVIEETIFKPKDVAYMEVKHSEGMVVDTFMVCGQFWYEEDNICPIIAMTHELGHYVDLTVNHYGNFKEYREIGIFEYEVRAWEFAIEFCDAIGLTPKYGKELLTYARTCLKSYYDNLPWDEYVNQRTFDNAMKRLMIELGLEEEPEVPEELRPKPTTDSFSQFMEMWKRHVSEPPVYEFQRPKNKEYKNPFERMQEQRVERQRQIKRGMRAKSWEL
jgi:hypothetical protein